MKTHDSIFEQAQATPLTLDGLPARLRGRLAPFAIVCRADGKGGDVEYSWDAVARIIANGGAFRS